MIKIHCKYDALVNPKDLKNHPDNSNKHGQDQIDQLAEIIKYQGWRHAIKVSKRSGFITTGHCRKLSAIRMGEKLVPVVYQEYEDEAQEYADLNADNAIALWAQMDFARINQKIPDLGPDFDINMLGIKDFEIEPADRLTDDDKYTKEIKIPIYEPKGIRPKIKELFDLKKMLNLTKEIEDSDLPRDEKEFLKFAAYRHIVFDYGLIAEYYSHADKKTQELMENSALVIIDFEKAIENNFIKMTSDMANLYQENKSL